MDFGHAIGQNPNGVEGAIYDRLEERFSVEQLTLLIAFAGIMAATNLFNNVAKVDLDEVLYNYTKKIGVPGKQSSAKNKEDGHGKI
jgi:hypothetical protein